MVKPTVSDVESLLQQAFQSFPVNLGSSDAADVAKYLNPSGFEPVIEVQENGKKKRRDASVDKLDFEVVEYKIYFVRSGEAEAVSPAARDNSHAQTASLQPPAQMNPSSARAGKRSQSTSAKQSQDVVAPLNSLGERSFSANPEQVARGNAPSAEDELCNVLEEIERQAKPFIALKWFRDDVLAKQGFSWAGSTEERQEVLARTVESGRVVTNRIPNPRSPYPTTTIRLNRSRIAGDAERQRYSPRPIRGESLSETILRDRGIR